MAIVPFSYQALRPRRLPSSSVWQKFRSFRPSWDFLWATFGCPSCDEKSTRTHWNRSFRLQNETANIWRNEMNMINKTLTITAYALLLTAAQTALAEPSVGSAIEPAGTPISLESTSATVSYAVQKLESEEGVREVYRLLQRASKEVCASGTSRIGRSVMMKSSHRQCYRKSLSNAVNKIDNENLTRFHAG